MNSQLFKQLSREQWADAAIGLSSASIILLSWILTLFLCLSLDVSQLSVTVVAVAVAIRTFLHTGIFITVHEAIHGVITGNRQIDSRIGTLFAWLYALLPYEKLAVNHWQHHQFPATEADPDCYCAAESRPIAWYFQFMVRYQDRRQATILFWGITVLFWSLVGLGVPVCNLILFWILPILLSSWQLFWFGIYQPHRKTDAGYRDRHRATSNHLSVFWSFWACYHFGYHWEHHQYPMLPWYRLPMARWQTGFAEAPVYVEQPARRSAIALNPASSGIE